MNRGANDQAKDLQLAAFRDHGCYMVQVSKMCACSYNQFLQSSNNGVIKTVKGLIEIFCGKIKALSDNLHQFNHHFKSHADSQRIAWCIAGLVLQLPKPLLNHRLAYGLIRKM